MNRKGKTLRTTRYEILLKQHYGISVCIFAKRFFFFIKRFQTWAGEDPYRTATGLTSQKTNMSKALQYSYTTYIVRKIRPPGEVMRKDKLVEISGGK